jgi:hypothetical protein
MFDDDGDGTEPEDDPFFIPPFLRRTELGSTDKPKKSPAIPKISDFHHWKLGVPSAKWAYRDETGNILGYICRFDEDTNGSKRGKEYRPLVRVVDDYVNVTLEWKGFPEPRPLYNLHRLAANPEAPVVVVEGEKATDALQTVLPDHIVTTSMHGAQSPGKTDWSPLAGRNVTIWPDADEAGETYANAVAECLGKVDGESVSIIPTDCLTLRNVWGGESFPHVTLPKGWDAADAVDEGWDTLRVSALLKLGVPHVTYTLRRERATLSNVTLPKPDMSILRPAIARPVFPVETFGPYWGRYLRETAAGVSAPTDFVGGALLTVAASLIGNSRWASPWDTWKEPPALWMMCVGTPSSGKSPAMDPVLSVLRDMEGDGVPEYEDGMRRYEADAQHAKLTREQWEKDTKSAHKKGVPIPLLPEDATEPVKPELLRLRVSDTTIEALGKRLSTQHRGVLFTRDELAGWLGNFDRYGGKGGDRAFWIEGFGGRSFTMERVKHGSEPVVIPNLLVSILGTIQPDRMSSLFMCGDDDGLPARFLYVWPQPVPRRRPTVTGDTKDALRALRRLLGLAMATDANGRPEPVVVPLSPDAAELFENWWMAEQDKEPDGRLASWWGKCPGYVLRLALVLQFLWWSAEHDETEPDRIGMAAIDAAIRLVDDYFKPMAALCHGDAALPEERRFAAALAREILERRSETNNARDIYTTWNVPELQTADAVKTAIRELEAAHWLHRIHSGTNPKGGRPREDYRVSPSP